MTIFEALPATAAVKSSRVDTGIIVPPLPPVVLEVMSTMTTTDNSNVFHPPLVVAYPISATSPVDALFWIEGMVDAAAMPPSKRNKAINFMSRSKVGYLLCFLVPLLSNAFSRRRIYEAQA